MFVSSFNIVSGGLLTSSNSWRNWRCLISSVQLLSRVRLFATPWITACHASLSITNSRSSLRLTSIESVMPSRHLILCRPLLLLPPNPSQYQSLFQWVNSLHEVAKVLSFSCSIIPPKEIPGLMFNRKRKLQVSYEGYTQIWGTHAEEKFAIFF